MLVALCGAAGANCLTDTSQADFQAGTPSGVDVTSSPGNVTLIYSSGGSGSLDQQNTKITTNGERSSNSTNTQWAGQTFTAGKSGSLMQVDVNLFCVFCSSAPPPIVVSIRATSGGLPTGSDLAYTTLTLSDYSGTQVWSSAKFASPVSVSAGTQYAIIVRPQKALSNGTLGFSDSAINTTTGDDVYGGGAVVYTLNGGSSWAVETGPKPSVDAGFKTYVGSGGSSGYNSSGDLISSVKDSNPPSGATPNWSTLTWTASLPPNTALKFQVAAANTNGGPFNFVGPDGTSGTYYTSSGQSLAQFNGYQYIKYHAYLSTGSSSSTPTLNDATVCYTNQMTYTADTSITNSDGAATAVPGTTVTYTIKASNAGPDGVTNATVSDTFPAPLTSCHWTCSASSGSACASSGNGNINDGTIDLSAGGSATYTATCSIPSSATGTISNSASISNPSGVTDPATGNNTATDSDTLTAQVDLQTTNNDGTNSQVAGTPASYTLTVQNVGPSDAPQTQVVDTPDSSQTCSSWTCAASGGAACPAAGSGAVNLTVHLPKGGRTTFTASCALASSATGTVNNTFAATPANGISDTNTANNSALDSDSIIVRPDVKVTMTDNVNNVRIGDAIDYVIQVSNLGPSDAAVNLTDNLPAQLSKMASWVCSGSGGASCSNKGNGNSMNTNATVPVGGVATYMYSSSVASDDAGDSFTNVAVAQVTNGTDPNTANNSASDTDTIVVFIDDFEGAGAAAMKVSVSGGGGASITTGVDGGLLGSLGPAPVTVATGRSHNGSKLFSLQLVRLGGDVLMRSLTPIDGTPFSDVSPWETVDLKQHLLTLSWQSATSRGDDGYLRAGSSLRQVLLSANNAPDDLTQLEIRVENGIPWLVPVTP